MRFYELTDLNSPSREGRERGNMKLTEKLGKKLNDSFTDKLTAAFMARFNVALESHFDIFSMRLISVRHDEQPLTQEQHDFIKAYEAGYLDAMNGLY